MAVQRSDDDRPYVWTVAELPQGRDLAFDIVPDTATCAALAAELGILAIKKLRFEGALSPEGKRDWRLDARLGVTVVQSCVVTLEPVTTRIDEHVARLFLSELLEDPQPGSETEFTADEAEEPLGREIDLWAVLSEALALALPAYPKAPDAGPADAVFAEPGVVPMTDDDARPFAGLADLKTKLDKNG
ncbi:MAG: DUF177 domain-containing protein [Rhodobacteraceae bacterium]|nr:DUF177 domain-containing protein [Paracoccaceae bacterium]